MAEIHASEQHRIPVRLAYHNNLLPQKKEQHSRAALSQSTKTAWRIIYNRLSSVATCTKDTYQTQTQQTKDAWLRRGNGITTDQRQRSTG